jgi:GTPase SAR1 family protein
MALKRPILIGGLGLTATLWLLDTVHFDIFDSSTLLSAMALGTGVWWWRQRDRSPALPSTPTPLVTDRAAVATEISSLQTLINTLETEIADAGDPAVQLSASPADYRQQVLTIESGLDRQRLAIAVLGDPYTGKSTLIERLSEALPDASAAKLSFTEIRLSPETDVEADLAQQDAVLLVTDSDLTESALVVLNRCLLAGQAALLVFNKQDNYHPDDRQTILDQLQHHAATLPTRVPVVGTAVAPRPTKVRRHAADGTVQEWMETTAPELGQLQKEIAEDIVAHTTNLVAATTLRQLQALRQTIQTDVNALRRQQAMPLVEQLQWVAGAAAFANPVPTLDLLATVAINGQLIMDLGKVYGFNLSMEEAKTAAGTLASLTVKLGLVELTSQLLTTILKSHFATYVAGGVIQGMSAAYLTRMAGISLIEYFEAAALAGTTTSLSWGAISQRLQAAIQQNGQTTMLKALVKQGIDILKPAANSAQLPSPQGNAVDLAAQPAP